MLNKILFVLTFLGLSIANGQEAPLLEIAGEQISKEDFLAVYNKNNLKDSVITKESLDEYIELYINFKLKVKEAESQGLHEQDKFKKEFEGYKKQLSQSYLEDKNVTEELVKEAYDRLKYEINASHILLELKPNALPEDTLKVYNEIMDLRKRAIKGEDFSDLAKKYSSDPSAAKNGGDLGYYTALKMVYPFETATYNTDVNEISMPVRTRFGYHIIKVHDKRETTGEWKVAHIMIKTGKNRTEAEIQRTEKLIREIHTKLQKGENFQSLAKNYSDDPASKRKGGELPWFRTNTYPREFENASFGLENNGDFSEPFLTDYGWHIVLRIDHKPMQSFEELEGQIRAKIARDSRSKLSKEVVITRIKKEYGFKEYKNNLKQVIAELDSSFFAGTWSAERGGKMKKKLFILDGKKYTQKDFMRYLQAYNGKRKVGDFKEIALHFYNRWVKETVVAYEESRLEEKYPEYKRLLEEYRNGILLFDITDQKVWSKAISDTAGLNHFYEHNKNDFMWERRVLADIYTCENDSTADALRLLLESDSSLAGILAKLNVNSELKVRVDQGKFEINDKEILSKVDWKVGTSVNIELNGKVFVVVIKEIIEPTPKALNEAKGKIIAAYQTYLDKMWIIELRGKYEFKINDSIYQTILPQ